MSTSTQTNSEHSISSFSSSSELKEPPIRKAEQECLIKAKGKTEKTLKKAFIKIPCKFCYRDHTMWKLAWPSCQHHLTTFIPTSNNQLEWPDKQVVEKYLHEFDQHKCEDCVSVISYWKHEYCDEFGISTKFGQSNIIICKNNLVKFGELPWWEKNGIP